MWSSSSAAGRSPSMFSDTMRQAWPDAGWMSSRRSPSREIHRPARASTLARGHTVLVSSVAPTEQATSMRRGCGMPQGDASTAGTDARQILGANPAMRRAWLRHNTGHVLDAAAETGFAPEETRGNIENLVGATQVPLGIGGPIRVNGQHADGLFYVPFATTEGTLVTTYQYGMRAITEAGGANAYVLADALDITPCFVVASTREALVLAELAGRSSPELQAVAADDHRARSSRRDSHPRVRPPRLRAVRVQHRRCDGNEHGQPGGRPRLPSRDRGDARVSATTSGATTRATRSPPPSTCSVPMARRWRST